jgi:hypothetical protein
VKTLQKICSESRQDLRLILENQQKRAPYAPLRIELEGESYARLEGVAIILDVMFNKTPQAWVLAAANGSLTEYVGQLEWSSQTEVNWDREDFDARHFAFTTVRPGTSGMIGGVRLSRYLNPTRPQWEYRLVSDNRSASVNPEWGRYAVLNVNHQNSVLYDTKSGSLAVARGTPLPVFIARALVLCSGYAARTVSARAVRSVIPEHYGFDVYDGIPQDVVDVIAHKLGQRTPVEHLSIQEETR